MGNISRTYSDLDLSFEMNPITRDVSKKLDANAVKQALKNLIMTRFFERGFQPRFGSQFNALLFEPFNSVTEVNMSYLIQQAIENFEPRVSVKSVDVKEDPNNNSISISITFVIVNTTNPITYKFSVYRAR